MTLFDLAIKNIKRNIKNYMLYLSSIVFTIAVYFTFVTLQHSDNIMSEAGSVTKVSTLMNMSSILLLIFAAIFISYSNTFFLKKRKKEVGLYLLLGIRKRKIGALLFFENLIIGIGALIVGIILGRVVSSGMLAALVKLMGIEVSGGLPLSIAAIKTTALVFVALFLFTSFQGYRVIYKFKLIELFQADKKGEQPPKPNLFVTLIGIALLATGYYFASVDMYTSNAWKVVGLAMPLVILLSTILGTYLLFHTVLVYVLSLLKRNKRWAWRGLNMMTVSQMLYRIRSNAKTLTVIAILSATTITAGGAIFGMYYNVERDINEQMPNTFMWEGQPLTLDETNITMSKEVEVKTVKAEHSGSSNQYSMMSESVYNELARFHNVKEVALSVNEAYIIDSFVEVRFTEDEANKQLKLNDLTLDVIDYSTALVLNSDLAYITAVVPDRVYNQLAVEPTYYQLVNTVNEKEQLDLSAQIKAQLQDTHLSSYPEDYNEMIQAIGALLFVGSFLGLVFLIATGSIIYFKMMTEAEEDKDKYEGLYKIGISFKEMKKTIRAQVGIIFISPLILAIMHAGFALLTFSNLFLMDIVQPVIIWMLIYSSVYAIYYVLTVKYFTGVIKKRIQA